MDYDNDGLLDMISGSYDPGDVYLFKGSAKGEYAGGVSILDVNGVPLVHHPVEMARYQAVPESERYADEHIGDRVASFGSFPALLDWDGDGDLDFLIGSFFGEIYLRLNIGDRQNPRIAGDAIRLENAAGPMKVNGHAHPVAVDWDRDGVWDLVTGAADGSVGWFRNEGTVQQPSFGDYRLLVPPVSENKFFEQSVEPGAEPVPGARAQICVADYDGDGWPDLLVGDFSEVKWTRPLSEQEQEELNAILAEMGQLVKEIVNLGYEGEEGERRQKLLSKYFALESDQKKFFIDKRRASFVWLYTRIPPAQEGMPQVEQPVAERRSISLPANKQVRSVAVSSRIDPHPEQTGEHVLIVTISIGRDWYVYAAEPTNGGVALTIDSHLPEGCQWTSEWESPTPEIRGGSGVTGGTRIFRGNVTFRRSFKVAEPLAAGSSVQSTIEFQVCNDRLCLPPERLTFTTEFDAQ